MQLFTYHLVSTLVSGRKIESIIERMFLSRALFEGFLEMENGKRKIGGCHTDIVYTEWTGGETDLLSKWPGVCLYINEDDICALVATGDEPWPPTPAEMGLADTGEKAYKYITE